MDIELKELKEKITEFVHKYDIADITIYIDEYVNSEKKVRLEIEV